MKLASALVMSVLLLSRSALALDPRLPPDDYVADHWGFAAGLPQVSVTSITQDRLGYLWMSTQGGLARFDGQRFASFAANDLAGYEPTITDHLWTDSNGRLWLGTPRGAALVEADKITAVAGLGPEVGRVHAFSQAPGGSVLIATERGLYAYTAGSAQRLGLQDVKVYALLTDGDRVYAGSDGTVFRIHGGIATAVESEVDLRDLRFGKLAYSGHRVYVGSSRGVFEIRGGQLLRPDWAQSLEQSSIESLYGDADGNLWIGLLDGLMRYNESRNLEWALSIHEGVRPWIASMFEDSEGNLWVGSYTTGLSRWWNGWAASIGTKHGLTDPFVWSVARGPQDEVWAGTATGLWRLGEDNAAQLVTSTRELPNSAIYNLFFASNGDAWLGTRAGMASWDGLRLTQPPEWHPLRSLQINAVLEAATGKYWIGTSDGLYYQDRKLFKRYGVDDGLSESAVRSLVEFEEQLFVGTERGLFVGLEGSFKRVPSDTALSTSMVTSLLPLLGGKLAIGTYNEGLFVRDLTGLTAIKTEHGLPWSAVANLQADDTHLWVSGPRGLYRLQLAALEKFLLHGGSINAETILNEGRDTRGGQRLRCCNAGASSRGLYLKGKLWLPSLNGVVRVDPDAVQAPKTPPHAIIEQVESDRGHLWPAIEVLPLPLGVRDLTLRYTALSFRDSASLRFRYRLHGYETDWQSPTEQRSVRYTNLGPGNFRFELQAFNGNQGQTSQIASISVQVPPTTSESWWFRSLMALMGLASIAVLIAALRRQSASRAQRLQKLVERRTDELRRANERLRGANQALAEESLTDGLTGLKNRRYLARYLADWRRRSLLGETAQERLWFFLMDLDHFKQVNDRLGHLVGDDILKQISQLLLRLAGANGHALRWGGEEFLLLIPESVVGSAQSFAERIVQAVRRADFRGNEVTRVPLTVSVGVSAYPALTDRDDIADWALAMELADAALYWTKNHGRDNWNRLIPAAQARYGDFSGGFGPSVEHMIERGLAAWERASSEG